MPASAPIIIDTLRGQAQLGPYQIAVAEAGPAGELRVGGEDGPVLRPLTFAERSRVVNRAVGTTRPVDGVCVGLLRAATVRPGAADPQAQEILALTLAGAVEEAPPFVEALLVLARATGWTLDQLASAEAAEVDRLALHLQTPTHEPGWNRLNLAPEAGDELSSLRTDLAERLLRRAGKSRHETGEAAATSPHSDAYPARPLFIEPGTGRANGPAPARKRTPTLSEPVPARESGLAANGRSNRAVQKFQFALAQPVVRKPAALPAVATATPFEGPQSAGHPTGRPAPGGEAAGLGIPHAAITVSDLEAPSRPAGEVALDEWPGHLNLFNHAAAPLQGLADLPEDPIPARAGRDADSEPARPWDDTAELGEMAAGLARLLDDEIDLRGIER